MSKGRRKTMKKKPKVWEEYPPSKYRCTLSDYIICLSADLACNKKYTYDEAEKKIDEAIAWVRQQPESHIRMI